MNVDLPQGMLKYLEQEQIPFTVIKPTCCGVCDMVRVDVSAKPRYVTKLCLVRDDVAFLAKVLNDPKRA